MEPTLGDLLNPSPILRAAAHEGFCDLLNDVIRNPSRHDKEDLTTQIFKQITQRIVSELESNNLVYASILIRSEDCKRLLGGFLKNAKQELTKFKQLIPQKIKSQLIKLQIKESGSEEGVFTPKPNFVEALPDREHDEDETSFEYQEEITAQLARVREACTPAELRVVDALLRSGWNYDQAATALGCDKSYLSHTLKRLRKKLGNLS